MSIHVARLIAAGFIALVAGALIPVIFGDTVLLTGPILCPGAASVSVETVTTNPRPGETMVSRGLTCTAADGSQSQPPVVLTGLLVFAMSVAAVFVPAWVLAFFTVKLTPP